MLAKRSGLRKGRCGRANGTDGSMPFSLVAVLLLVLSSISVVIIFSYNDSHEDARLPVETIQRMKETAAAACEDVKRSAYSAALDAIRETRDLDEALLSQRFSEAFNAALNESYPDDSGRFRVAMHLNNVTLKFMQASLADAYIAYGGDTDIGGRVSLPAFFALSGGFVLNVSNHHGRILFGQDIDQDIYLPLPFLFDRLARLTSSAAPLGDLQNMVGYMLSALAQERVLMGYGIGAQVGARSTEAVLSDEDVVRAVNLAIVIEELRIFRSADEAALAEFPELQEALDGDLKNGLDPADLFLSTYGDGEIDLAPLVSQAILTVMDRMIFSALDYFHVIDITNFAEDAVEGFIWGVRDLADFITGGDSAQDDIMNYISEVMEEAGYPEAKYRWFNYGSGNALITLPEFELTLFDENNNRYYQTFGGTYAIDFPDVDVFASEAWGEFYRQYISSTYWLVREVREFIAEVAEAVATHCTLSPAGLVLDPSDGRGFMEEMAAQIMRSFRENPDWLRPAMDHVKSIEASRDDLAVAAAEFMDRHWTEVLCMNWSVRYGAQELSKVLVKQIDRYPELSEASREKARLAIEMGLRHPAWGLDIIEGAFTDRAQSKVLAPFQYAMERKTDTGFFENLVVKAISYGAANIPGIEAVITCSMTKMVGDMSTAAQMWGGKINVPLGQEGFQLVSRNGMERTEHLQVISDLLSLSTDGVNGLSVAITRPWDYDRADTACPNRHVTDLGNLTFSPYLTQWEVSYQGSVRVTLSVAAGSFDGAAIADVPCAMDITVAGQLIVVTSSAWGLTGVDYRPTATLLGDIVKFITKAWDFMVSGAQIISGMASRAFNIFAQMLTVTLTTAVRPLEALNDLLMAGVDALERLITGTLSGLIGAIADVTQSVLGGTTVRLSLFGIAASLVIAPRDSALAEIDDQIRIDASLSSFGALITSSLRVLKLADGSHTILGNVAMSRDDWRIEIIVDPLMKVYSHMVEARGFSGDRVIELVLPEVRREQKVSVALSDIPGLGELLKLIPSPVPGAKFHIDGGIEVSFNLLSKSAIMINEFEQNPAGEDRSKEKVELFNPTDRPIDLSGWSLVTSHGNVRNDLLSNVVIPARGYYVYTFSGQALDNGGGQGFPLQESLALLDPSGKRVDSAPWVKDLADDGRTWQRAYDGSGTWEFKQGTLGRSNGGVLFRELDTSGLGSMLTASFQDAFWSTPAAVPDARTVEDLFRTALSSLREKMLDAVGDAVSSVKIFLRFGLEDYSGSLGAGVGLALVADGKAVRECFAWAADAVGQMLCDPLNPLGAMKRVPVPADALGEHVFIQFAAYFSVGAPGVIEAVAGETEMKAAVTIGCSLGVLGVGSGGGTIRFGMVISDLPGPRIKTGAFSASDSVSVWMLKGTITKA